MVRSLCDNYSILFINFRNFQQNRNRSCCCFTMCASFVSEEVTIEAWTTECGGRLTVCRVSSGSNGDFEG